MKFPKKQFLKLLIINNGKGEKVMAHELEEKNGKLSMAYVGDNPWHRGGVYLGETEATAEEMIKASGLDWEVSQQEISCDGSIIPEFKAIVRNDNKAVLGIRGGKYTPYQNKDAFKALDPFIGKDKACWHTAGVLGKGERIWVLAKL